MEGMTSQELKSEMMKAIEAEVEALVAWEAKSETMTLTEIEDKLLAARQRISQEWASQMIGQREARRNAAIPEREGKRLHPKGKKKRGHDPVGGGELPTGVLL